MVLAEGSARTWWDCDRGAGLAWAGSEPCRRLRRARGMSNTAWRTLPLIGLRRARFAAERLPSLCRGNVFVCRGSMVFSGGPVTDDSLRTSSVARVSGLPGSGTPSITHDAIHLSDASYVASRRRTSILGNRPEYSAPFSTFEGTIAVWHSAGGEAQTIRLHCSSDHRGTAREPVHYGTALLYNSSPVQCEIEIAATAHETPC